MRKRNIPETRRCCAGSYIARGRASFLQRSTKMADEKGSKKNTGHGPGKVVKPGANVAPKSWWLGKGVKKTKKK